MEIANKIMLETSSDIRYLGVASRQAALEINWGDGINIAPDAVDTDIWCIPDFLCLPFLVSCSC